MQKYLGELSLLLVTVVAAIGWFFSKYAIEEMPPIGFIGLRFLLASILFLPFAYPQLKQIPRRLIVAATGVGLIFTLNLVFWVSAITYSNEFGIGAFLVSLSMLIAPMVSWLIFKQRPQPIFWLSLPIASIGLYFLSASSSAVEFSIGTLFFLLAALAAAIYFVLNNQYAKQISPLSLTCLQLGVVGVLCTCYSWGLETWQHQISPATWMWFLASVLIATCLRFFLQTLGQKYCNITNAALIMTLEPVWTLLLSVWILAESLTWQKILGCSLILTALFVYSYYRRQSTKSQTSQTSPSTTK